MSQTQSSSPQVHFVLPQAALLKQVIESLKDMVPEAYLILDSKGLSLTSFDTAHVALVHCILPSASFETFTVTMPPKRKKIELGISLSEMDKILKSIYPNDRLEIYHTLSTDLLTFKGTGSNKWQFDMKLIEPSDADSISMPPIVYDAVEVINPTEFNRLCKSLLRFSSETTISRTRHSMYFVSTGTGTQRVKLELNMPDNYTGFYQQKYSLKYLDAFSKAGSASTDMTISFAAGVPMRVAYSLDVNGAIIEFYLQPMEDEQ